MELNKNKIIFAIIGVILLIGIIFIILNLNTKTNTTKSTNSGNFNIWILGNNDSVNGIIEDFKKLNPEYSNSNIIIENFSNYDDYFYSLVSALGSDKAPDIFVLNNNEKNPVFSNYISGIDPSVINPNDFRKKYKGVFSDDLIISSGEGEDLQEFLMGIPVGYESLGIFYNRRYVKSIDLASMGSLNNKISDLKEKRASNIPIGIGNGSTVPLSGDIAAQFFLFETGVSKIGDVLGRKVKESLGSYLLYGDIDGTNSFNSRFAELASVGENSIDLFSKANTYMVVGYPRLINEIDEKGFGSRFLLASPFPHYIQSPGKTLVNYDYFVINKSTQNISLANKFLSYLSSDIGASKYLEIFKYYLPALLSLESDKLDEKIHDDYNITLKDFYSNDYELSSFDKGIKNIYDKEIINILDNSSNYESSFDKLRNTILCKAKKISTLENLSLDCEK